MKGVVSACKAEVVLADNDDVVGVTDDEVEAAVTGNVTLPTGSITTQHGSRICLMASISCMILMLGCQARNEELIGSAGDEITNPMTSNGEN